MANFNKNAVKILPKTDRVDDYLCLYTEFDGKFTVGDRLYIMVYESEDSNCKSYLDSYETATINNGIVDSIGVILVDKVDNKLILNINYNSVADENENVLFSISDTDLIYISRVYIEDATINNGSVNALMCNSILMTPVSTLSVTWYQGIILNSISTINNVKFDKKYTSSTSLMKTSITDGDVTFYNTKNNMDNGISFIGTSNEKTVLIDCVINEGEFLNCQFDKLNQSQITFNGGKIIDSVIIPKCIINNGYFYNTNIRNRYSTWKNGRYFKDNVDASDDSVVGNDFAISVWENGTWEGGWFPSTCVWNNGRFLGGIFNKSVWNAGIFYDGYFQGSIWKKGYFNGGSFIEKSEWQDGTFNNGNFFGSTWIKGTFNNGKFTESYWTKGEFNGTFYNSTWIDGNFNGGDFSGIWYQGNFLKGNVAGYEIIVEKYNEQTQEIEKIKVPMDTIIYGGNLYNAVISDNTQINNSVIHNCKIKNSTVNDCSINYAVVSENTVVNRSLWYDGIANNATFNNVRWYNGISNYALFFNTWWYDGSFNDGTFGQSNNASEKSIWYNGKFFFGTFNGEWSLGTFYMGNISNKNSKTDTFYRYNSTIPLTTGSDEIKDLNFITFDIYTDTTWNTKANVIDPRFILNILYEPYTTSGLVMETTSAIKVPKLKK